MSSRAIPALSKTFISEFFAQIKTTKCTLVITKDHPYPSRWLTEPANVGGFYTQLICTAIRDHGLGLHETQTGRLI